MQKLGIQTKHNSLVKNSHNRDTPMPTTTTASELYAQLGIAEPFKEWIARQPGFGQFKSFFGTLPDGKLGKDYRLTSEQAALLVLAKTGKNSQPPADVKPKPKVIIDGQVSVYWFCNNRGLPCDKNSLHKLGMQAGEKCQELGIVMGIKFQQEIRPDRSKFQGRVRTYPLEVLESLMTNAPMPDNTQLGAIPTVELTKE